MTIINGIEIDDIRYDFNDIKYAIENNDPIEDYLHVIAVVSNPCLFAKRYILMREFINRFEKEETRVILYIVELAYGKQKFIITDSKNPRHLQLRTETPLWHKENMINLGVRRLLPANWKAFAWIDADIEFDNTSWALDTLKILNGSKDIVQLFSHCVDMDNSGSAMRVFNSASFQYSKRLPYTSSGPNLWHPGYAWAMTRKLFERVGGLYDKAILGAGDSMMMWCLLENWEKSINDESSEDYKASIAEYQKKMKNVRWGYVPGVIHHYYHGSKKNRGYNDRWKYLIEHNYSPVKHIVYDHRGIIVPTAECPKQLLDDIMGYFGSRNEDEFCVKANKFLKTLKNV
jgi:hypothetical protein